MTPFRYSTISDFHKCAKYYELKHILKEPDGSDKAGELKFGSAIHLGVQDLLEGGDGIDVFTAYWELQRDKGLEYSVYNRLSHDQHLTMGRALLEIFRDEHMKKFTVLNDPDGKLLVERKMLGKVGPHSFGGTADCIAEYRGVPSLVDWKTSSQPYDNLKLIYNEQIYGYIELARQDLGLILQQGVYGVAVKDIKNPRWQFKTAHVTSDKLTKVLANVLTVCNTIVSTVTFHRNPNSCVMGKRKCAYFEICFGGRGGEEEGQA